MQRVWYAAYGTNLSQDRFRMYLRGGRPFVHGRHHPGARDPDDPADDVALLVPGGLRFVGVSSIWGGGMAVYDAGADGEVAVRAYLITAEQFLDVLAQEMRLAQRLDLDLAAVEETGWHSFGAGSYQTLTRLLIRDEIPMLTFTSADVRRRPVNAPSEPYLRTMARGLREAHGWSAERIGDYLTGFPGAAGTWTQTAIRALAD